jgi:predicted DNA-binding transcriptional regulator YafY
MAKKSTKQETSRTQSKAKSPIGKRPDRDRRVRQSEKIARVLQVLQLIQSRALWDTKSIAAELGCAERTVYRDLNVLNFAGVPWYRDESTNAICVRPDYRFPIPNLTEEEVLGQALATAATKVPGLDVGAGAAPTTRKIAAASKEEVKELLSDASRLVCVLDLKLADHSRHHEMIKTIQFALIQRKQIVGDYESPYEKKPVKVRLEPYRLCLIKNAWYLIARSPDSTKPLTYRVNRFKTLRMVDQLSIVPEDFNLKDYFGNAWAVFRGSQTFNVEIWFAPEAARVVTETVWHHTQKSKSHSDGSVSLTFRVDGLEEIAGWILSWAGKVKVIKPVELRDMVVERLKLALEMNQN